MASTRNGKMPPTYASDTNKVDFSTPEARKYAEYVWEETLLKQMILMRVTIGDHIAVKLEKRAGTSAKGEEKKAIDAWKERHKMDI